MMEAALSVMLFIVLASLLSLVAAARADLYGDTFTMLSGPSLAFVGAGACASAIAGEHGLLVGAPAIAALACLTVSAASDLQTGYIFDLVTAAAGALVLICSAISGDVVGALGGALSAGGALLVLHVITRGRGMGLGDVKLAAVIGAGFGVLLSLVAIGVAFVVGASIVVVALAARRMRRGDTVRFGPYLAIGTILLVVVRGFVW